MIRCSEAAFQTGVELAFILVSPTQVKEKEEENFGMQDQSAIAGEPSRKATLDGSFERELKRRPLCRHDLLSSPVLSCPGENAQPNLNLAWIRKVGLPLRTLLHNGIQVLLSNEFEIVVNVCPTLSYTELDE